MYFCLIRGREIRQEDVESLSTLRLEGSPTQSRISPSIQRILNKLLLTSLVQRDRYSVDKQPASALQMPSALCYILYPVSAALASFSQTDYISASYSLAHQMDPMPERNGSNAMPHQRTPALPYPTIPILYSVSLHESAHLSPCARKYAEARKMGNIVNINNF